jgi:hypothetical protein
MDAIVSALVITVAALLGSTFENMQRNRSKVEVPIEAKKEMQNEKPDEKCYDRAGVVQPASSCLRQGGGS